MPKPPSVALHTRWILENPWPLGGVLLLVGVVLVWLGLRDGLKGRLQVGAGVLAAGLGVLIVGSLVTTAGEHAMRVTRELVKAATAADITTATSLFSPTASFSVGKP